MVKTMLVIIIILTAALIFSELSIYRGLVDQRTRNHYVVASQALDEVNIQKLSSDLQKLAVEVKKLKEEDVYINSVVSGR